MTRATVLLLVVLALGTANARAQPLVADLSSHLVAITTGFTGTDVVLFGTTGGEGEVAVVVSGPRSRVVVRRKDRIAGVWINQESLAFDPVPAFYAVGASRPPGDLAPVTVLERAQVGLDHLDLPAADRAPPEVEAVFRAALIRHKQEQGLYVEAPIPVTFLGERLFRMNIQFPAWVPTGLYTVQVLLFRDGDVVSAQTTPLVVSKVGFSAEVFDFARNRPLLYGVAAVVGAVAAGWVAGAIFRKA